MKHIKKHISVGDHYIDCGYIPRVCVRAWGDDVEGRSLVDGSIGGCSRRNCGPSWVHPVIAKRWAKTGPLSKNLKESLIRFYNNWEEDDRVAWWERYKYCLLPSGNFDELELIKKQLKERKVPSQYCLLTPHAKTGVLYRILNCENLPLDNGEPYLCVDENSGHAIYNMRYSEVLRYTKDGWWRNIYRAK